MYIGKYSGCVLTTNHDRTPSAADEEYMLRLYRQGFTVKAISKYAAIREETVRISLLKAMQKRSNL